MAEHDEQQHQDRFERFQVKQNMDGSRFNIVDGNATFCNIVSAGWSLRKAAEAMAVLLNGGVVTVESVRESDREFRESGQDREEGFENYGPEQAKALVTAVAFGRKLHEAAEKAAGVTAEPPTYRY